MFNFIYNFLFSIWIILIFDCKFVSESIKSSKSNSKNISMLTNLKISL